MVSKKKNKTKTKPSSSLKKYKNSIKKLESEISDLNNKYLRLLAEFENFKNRSETEKNNIRKYEGIEVIKSILPILDDFDRTLNLPDIKKNKSIYNGINMIASKISSIFNDIGVEPFNSLNKEFDIEFHEALMTKPSKKKSNIVVEEFEKGYKYHDKIIRHAKVIVSE